MPPLKAEDFLDTLNDEERAAIIEGEKEDAAGGETTGADAGAEGAKPAEAAGDKPGAAADKPAGEKDKPAETVKPDAAAAAVDTAAKPAATEAEAKPEAALAPRQAIPEWQAPENAKAQLEQINAKRDALADRFDAGEITAKELFAQQREFDNQARQIERAVERADMSAQMTEAVWTQTTVPAFLEANAHYRDNPTLNNMLDAEVRRLQVAAGIAGKDPLAPSILIDADKAIKASLGALGTTVPEVKVPEGGKKPAVELKPGQPVIPPTLARVPASDIPATDNGKFAALDNLEGAAFEEAVAKLSEAERNAYLASSH